MRDGAEAEAKLTLGQVIDRTASSFPHQPAIVSSTFAALTYRDLQRQLDRIAAPIPSQLWITFEMIS
jgi:non-ribosomal peptide synthetase component E (peptide arylation enzyme)